MEGKWQFRLDAQVHVIRISLSQLTGFMSVYFDDTVIQKKLAMITVGEMCRFERGGHSFSIKKKAGHGMKFKLYIDGQDADSMLVVEERQQEVIGIVGQADMKVASDTATNALIAAILGFFVCAIVLGPYAISQAGKAKQVLRPGDPGYRRAQAAQILGIIGFLFWVTGIIVACLGQISGQ